MMKLEERITISLTRFGEPNEVLWAALDSLAAQVGVQADVLFLDQIEDSDTREYLASLNKVDIRFEYRVIAPRSLSYARNQAIQLSSNDIVLFLDADAIAEPDWAVKLAGALKNTGVGLAGGRILPLWRGCPPWIARSSIVRDMYSLLDLGDLDQPTEKIVGANFGLRLSMLGTEAYFDEQLGRRPGVLLSGEESDLAARVFDKGVDALYVAGAVVRHQILPERLRHGWILRRMYWQGWTRAMVGGRPRGTNQAAMIDYLVLPLLLPAYLVGFIRGRLSKGSDWSI